MSCSPFDLKEYFLKELTVPQAAQVEDHVHACSGCREELDRLRLTEAALFSLRDEEIPQRIAFVSDKIFEPSPVRRWLSAFWGQSARLGFASAAMLSAAIVFSATYKPAPAPDRNQVVTRLVTTPGPTQEENQARIDAAVAKAVDQAVAQSETTKKLVADLKRANEEGRALLVRAAGEIEMLQKRQNVHKASLYDMPKLPDGEGR
jgi:anti-sigma factor RsiW